MSRKLAEIHIYKSGLPSVFSRYFATVVASYCHRIGKALP